jgi:GntR family transcriptional regulator/MocR family aminotransferase
MRADQPAVGRVPVDLVLSIDPAQPDPLHRQLYAGLRLAILDRRVKPGARLPSTRTLATALGLARNTVHGAYDQLIAEGYLETRHGSGTYVASSLPDDEVAASALTPTAGVAAPRPCLERTPSPSRGEPAARPPGTAIPSLPSPLATPLSAWGQRIATARPAPYTSPSPRLPIDFRHGRPDTSQFPHDEWRRLAARQLRQADREDLWYGPPAGLLSLREAIAEYLGRARGVRCVPDQVIITTGTQQAIDLTARLLVDDGDTVVVEDPCYPSARRVFTMLGASIVDVPVDDHGLRTDALPEEPARLLYTTPSHQYPLGATLPVSRRLELLAWADRQGAIVIEDDYDSEFRHAGRPLEAMQGLDRSGRVVYVGSFSKVLYPTLRLGYLIAPPALVGHAREAKRLLDLQTATAGQEALAELMESGQFEAHLRRMRRLYRTRRAVLLDALARDLPGLATPGPSEAGLYLHVVLAAGLDETAVAERAAARGVGVYPARPYFVRPVERPGLVLGYSALDEEAIVEGIRRLRLAIDEVRG